MGVRLEGDLPRVAPEAEGCARGFLVAMCFAGLCVLFFLAEHAVVAGFYWLIGHVG